MNCQQKRPTNEWIEKTRKFVHSVTRIQSTCIQLLTVLDTPGDFE